MVLQAQASLQKAENSFVIKNKIKQFWRQQAVVNHLLERTGKSYILERQKKSA